MLTGIKVTKRDGRIELLDITKIQKYTSTACEGLENVNQSELELDAKIQFRDLISTEEIQQTLIKTAVDKIDVDRPNWTFVAARLFLYDLYHKVSRWSGYNHLREYFKKGEEEGRIVLGLKEKYDLDDLNDYIKPERDLQFTYLGIKTLYDRYLIKDKQGNPIELPQHMFMAISMFLAQNEENPQEWAKKFYDILSKFEVMAATPTLSNARTPRHQLSSCFLKGTPVKTIDGEIAIDELKIGDYVLTHTKEYKKVEELFIRDFAGQLITLNINGLLREIKATEEHPILSIKKNDVSCDRKLATCLFNQKNSKYCFKLDGQYKNDCEKLNKDLTKEIKWNEIQNLEEGDFVSISFSNYTHNKKEILVSDFVNLKNLVTDENYIFLKRSNCSFINDRGFVNTQTNKIKNKIPLNNNFMLFLGYFLAEGHISKNRDNLTLTFATKEQNYIIQTIEIVKDIFDYEPYIKENTDNSTSVIISNKLIAEFIYQLVKTGFNKKRLTPIIKFADKEVQKSLLIGVIRGDGCAIEEGYQLTLSNQGLIEDLFEIALRCGLSPYMFKGQKNHLANYYPYHLKIGSKNDKNFIFEVDKNIEKINLNQKGNSTLRYFWLENKFFMKITKIETKTINEKVYNIEVEDDHSYSVNFVDVHNCFVGSMNDNIEGIFDDYKEMALLSKFGGGIGWDFSKIRALGSFIDNHKNAAGGVIPWLRITNDIAIAVDQLGCVAKNSYIKVLDYVQTDNFKHEFRKEYQTHNLNQKEILEGVAGYASSFAFKYGKFSKNFIRSLLFDYVMNKKGSKFLENTYNLTHDQYKKIIGKYKKINKGLPEGFETLIDYPNYAISKSGIIINLDNLRPLKTSIDRKGYVRVTIGKNAVQLHLLLAKQFLNYDNTQTIDHIDGDKLNNNLENLQIISNEKNISKGWEDSYKKRTEMARIRKHLSFGHKLKGDKRDTHSFEIKKIKTKIIPIDKVRIGDLVLSYDIKTNQTQFKPLIAKHEIDVKQKDQIKISFEDGNYIITSNWHPFPKLENKKVIYVRSDSLKVGDITINDKNEFVKISKISKPKVASEFYDLTIKDNNNYFCSTSSKKGNFHLIHNTRKGAIAVYLEPWHMDILDFLELKKNSGEERRRAHDLFPALWINDLFMKRVLNDDFWTLFDPYEVGELSDLFGEEFEKRYIEYEQREDLTKHKVKAKDLWKKALVEYYETGNPFLCFKDNANIRNQNSHSGVIRSSNLCTEIYQNTEPNHYKIKITYEDMSEELFEEEELVTIDGNITKPAKKLSSIDSINGKKIYIAEKEKTLGMTAVCNLASVNLSKINSKDDFARVIPIAVRMLDNVIDLNFYPERKVKDTNLKNRAIGLGVMGEAQMLAQKQIMWGSDEHFHLIDEIMENFSYWSIKTSASLSKEKGCYAEFDGSNWSKGILPIDTANSEAKKLVERDLFSPNCCDWDSLREEVKGGMRNGYLMAIAPTSSISILSGTTQTIEPVYKRKWFEENLSGLIPVVVPNLNPDTWQYYTTAYELDQKILVKAAAIRQKWIDQGQSLNIFIDPTNASGKYLHEIYTLGWKLGIKSFYYLRSKSPEAEKDVMDRTVECMGCQ